MALAVVVVIPITASLEVAYVGRFKILEQLRLSEYHGKAHKNRLYSPLGQT